MRFPAQDLSVKYISSSYQDVVQQFIPTGSMLYLLDGYGNVIFQIPSASFGGVVLTNDQTSSYALHSISASYAPGNPSISASYALSSSYSITTTLANVALIADEALSASVAETANTASYVLTSSNALTASHLLGSIQSATYSVSASWASQSLSCSVATTSTSASYTVTASYVTPSTISINILNNSTASIIDQSASIYNGVFLQYLLTDGVNLRAGNVVVVYTTSSVRFNEICTTDIGNNDSVILSASISGSSMVLSAMNSSDVSYTLKYSLTTL